MPTLTGKQALFVREYLVDLNATQAALRAGYSDGTYGRQLLKKPHVADELERARRKLERHTEVTAERVLKELARIGFADIRDLFEWDEESATFVPSRDLSEAEAAAIGQIKAETTTFRRIDGTVETQVKLEIKTHDKLGALREIGKHLGIAERHEHSGPGGEPMEVEVTRRIVKAPAPRNRINQHLEGGANGANGKH